MLPSQGHSQFFFLMPEWASLLQSTDYIPLKIILLIIPHLFLFVSPFILKTVCAIHILRHMNGCFVSHPPFLFRIFILLLNIL
jgi:hypothetical protein